MTFQQSLATISLASIGAIACSDTSAPPSPPPPVFGITATITGAVSRSYAGVPSFGQMSVTYEESPTFEIRSESGGSQFITIWGESRTADRPTIGTFSLSSWRKGIVGQRVHAEYRVRTPGGENAYYAVSGTFHVTASSPDAVVAQFRFEGVPGFLLPDSAVLRHDLPHVQVTGELTALCDPSRSRCT